MLGGEKTGPSYASLKIKPVGYNDQGQILCKAYQEINEMGAHAMIPRLYLWLIVDAKGTWEIGRYKYFPGEFCSQDYEVLEKRLLRYNRWYKRKVDFNNPTDKLKRFLKGRVFKSIDQLPSNMIKYSWKNGRLFDQEKNVLQEKCKQKTLGKRVSYGRDGKRVHSSYVLFGVAFFENQSGYNEEKGEEENVGAKFFRPDPENGF